MSNLILNDRLEQSRFGGLQLPKFKGHVKIMLHDHKTGHDKTIEGDNIITNAIPDILGRPYLSALNAGSMLDLASKWFGGILVYEQAHTLNADNYMIPDDTTNHLWAHAGDEAPSSAAIVEEDLTRGAPVRTVKTANSVKFTWEWGHRQGNSGDRYMRAISLTHKDTGNAGLGCDSTEFHNFVPFEQIQSASLGVADMTNDRDNVFCMYDDNHALSFALNTIADPQKKTTTKKLTVYIRKLPYLKVGLHETLHADVTYQRAFTVEVSNFNFYVQPCYWFDYTNKKLWVFSNATGYTSYSNTTINYAVIDCINEDIDDEGTIVADESDLSAIPMYRNSSSIEIYNPNIIRNGDYFYFPTSNGVTWGNNVLPCHANQTGYRAINISNNDQFLVEFQNSYTQSRFDFATMCGGLIIANGHVVNGTKGYQCADSLPNTLASSYALSSANQISSFVSPTNEASSRYILANKMVNTTLFNLPTSPTPIRKTATESMTIEYTITES